MKKLTLSLSLLICGCSAIVHPDMDKSKALVENLIKAENSGDYSNMAQYYTADFNKSESADERTAKYQKLHEAMGNLTTMECLKATDSTDANDFPSVDLKYRVKHTKVNSIEEFTVIKEGGDYKIEEQSIMQEVK